MEEKTNTLDRQPTCEDLEQKIETLKKEIAQLQESLATLQEKGKTFVNQKMEIEEELKK
jgi:prefoldin subunit 5